MAPRSHDAPVAPVAPAAAAAWRGPLDFDAVYDEHFALVWRTARRLGVPESAAADVVQDVFLVVHRRLADYDGRTPVKCWLLGIVTRVVTDHRRTYFRKDSRCVPPEVDKDGAETMASPDPAPLEQAARAEALRLVVSLLDELGGDKREVLVLAEFEEMSAVEIAECLGLNVNTVYGRLRAARRAFDEAYARHRARAAWRLR
jgi:RNA polymerase sigma-70 factor, ECF subfamily